MPGVTSAGGFPRARVVVGLLILLTLLAIATIVGLVAAGRGPRLAVVDAAGGLSTMDGQGGSVVRYPAPGVALQFPAWSPDGTRIAAVGQAGDEFGIYVFDARLATGDPPAPTVIYRSTERPAFYLYWTPDSRQLAFLTTEANGLALRVAPADAARPDSIVRQGAPMYWTWLDPGSLEIHTGSTGPGAFLGEIGLDGASIWNPVASPGFFRAPAVSRDGRYRSYAALAADVSGGPDAPARLVVEARDGSTSKETAVFGIAAFGFDPGGTALAFVAADKPTAIAPLPFGPLRVMDPATGSVRTIVETPVVAFFWAPDGRTIASLRVDSAGGIQARSADGVPVASTARGAPPVDVLQATGFALHLEFTDVGSGVRRSDRTVRVSELFGNQLLPFFDQYALSHRLWSPDSAAVVLPLVDDRGVGLYVIRADGSEPVRLADGTMAFWSP